MNTARRVLSAAALLVTASAHGSSVDEVLQRHIEAMGGKQAMAAVESVLRVGDISVGVAGGEPMTGTIKSMAVPREKAFRDTSLGMFSSTAGWNGEMGWEKSRMGIRELAGEELARIRREAYLFFTTGIWTGEEVSIEYAGTESVDGTDYHVLRYSSPDWDGFSAYVDPDSYLVRRITARANMPGSTEPSDILTELEDYNAYEGVMFADRIRVEVKDMFTSDIQYTRTIINGPSYDSVFEKPEAAAGY